MAYGDLQQVSGGGVAGSIEPALGNLASHYAADFSALGGLYNLVKLDRVRVEFVPSVDSITIVANIQNSGSGSNPPYYGELCTARPSSTALSITGISKDSFMDFAGVRRTMQNQLHVRSFVPQAERIETYTQQSGVTYLNARPVRYPMVTNSFSGLSGYALPRCLPIYYYIDGANNTYTNSDILYRVYITYWCSFYDRL